MNLANRTSFPWFRAFAIVIGIVIAFSLFWTIFTPWVTLWLSSETFSYVVDNIVDVSGMSPYLVKGVVLVAIIPFGWAIAEVLRFGVWERVASAFGRRSTLWVTKRIALTVLTAYVAAYFFVMFAASRGQNFRHTAGGAQRWYAVTPEGVRFFDSPGFDPKYGLKLQPVTPALAVNLARAERGQTPARLVVRKFDELQFFDTLNGQAKVWYFRNSSGDIELYSQPGHHPAYGDELLPVSRDIVSVVRQQFESHEKQAEAERIAGEGREAHQREEATRLAARRQHEEDVARYTNPVSPQQSAAVVIVSAGQFDQELASKLASALGGTSALFKSAFVSSGKFEAALNGDVSVLRKLDVQGRAKSVVLVRASTETAVSSVVGNDIYKGETTLQVRVFRAEGGFSSQGFTITGRGTGFASDEARKKSEEDAIGQVAGRLKS